MADELPRIDRHVLEASPFAHIVYTPDLVIVEANRRYCALVGRRREDLVGRPLFEAFPANPDDADVVETEARVRRSVAATIATGEPDEMALRYDTHDAEGRFAERHWRVTHAAIRADADRPDSAAVAVVQTLREVTAEALERRREAVRLRMASAAGAVETFDYNPVTDVFLRSPAVDALFGFEDDSERLAAPFFARMHPDDLPAVESEIRRALVSPTPTVARFDYRIVRPDGTVRWIMSRGEVAPDPETRLPHVVGMLADVTAIREREQRLGEAVAERDMLLAEVNHRVKNSLQLVSSILSLEAGGAAGTPAAALLRSAAGKVEAIASVHGALYLSADVRTVELGAFMHTLCDHAAASAGAAERGVAVDVAAAAPIVLATDRAIPLALVVNELVAGALRHAPPAGRPGRLGVTARAEDGRIRLAIAAEDGEGAAAAPGRRALRAELGSRLLAALSRQIDATVSWEERPLGYAIRVELDA